MHYKRKAAKLKAKCLCKHYVSDEHIYQCHALNHIRKAAEEEAKCTVEQMIKAEDKLEQ